MYILVVGNIIDGLQIIGPFDDSDEVCTYAEHNCAGMDWVCGGLTSKEEWLK